MRICLWSMTVLLFLLGIILLPGVPSILLILAGGILLPIAPWQRILRKALPKAWMRIALIVLLLLAAILATSVTKGEPHRGDASVNPPGTSALDTVESIGSDTEEDAASLVNSGEQSTDALSSTTAAPDTMNSSDTGEQSTDALSSTTTAPDEMNSSDTDEQSTDALPSTTTAPDEMNSSDNGEQSTDALSSTTAAPDIVNSSETDVSFSETNSTFTVHFIDVGQADAALILCDGASMLIDGGNAADSNLIYTYLKKWDITYLDVVVNTHPHEDHVGGLAGALHYADVGIAYAPVTTYDSKAFCNFTKALEQKNLSLTVPTVGDTFSLGSAVVTVLGPITMTEEVNNTSIVLHITYGETSFLFMGDAEVAEEEELLAAKSLSPVTVLKVGHHGASTSTSEAFLKSVSPMYAVISVGKGNTYGHPTQQTLTRLGDAGIQVFRTDLQGDILCESDGKTVTFSVARNADIDTLVGVTDHTTESGIETKERPQETEDSEPVEQTERADNAADTEYPQSTEHAGSTYILNINTKKFHFPGCASAGRIKAENRREYTGSRDALLAEGYSPCGNCHP